MRARRPIPQGVHAADANRGVSTLQRNAKIFGQGGRGDCQAGWTAGKQERPFTSGHPLLRDLADTTGDDLPVHVGVCFIDRYIPVAVNVSGSGPQPLNQGISKNGRGGICTCPIALPGLLVRPRSGQYCPAAALGDKSFLQSQVAAGTHPCLLHEQTHRYYNNLGSRSAGRPDTPQADPTATPPPPRSRRDDSSGYLWRRNTACPVYRAVHGMTDIPTPDPRGAALRGDPVQRAGWRAHCHRRLR